MATGRRTDYEYKNILCIIIYIICDVILCVRRLRIMIWAPIYIVIWHSEDSQLVKICIELLNNCWICGPHWMVCGACVCVIKWMMQAVERLLKSSRDPSLQQKRDNVLPTFLTHTLSQTMCIMVFSAAFCQSVRNFATFTIENGWPESTTKTKNTPKIYGFH